MSEEGNTRRIVVMTSRRILNCGIDECLDSNKPVVKIVGRVSERKDGGRKPCVGGFRHIFNGELDHCLSLLE
jgi:hypothetical protein